MKKHLLGLALAATLATSTAFAVNGSFDFGYSEITRGMGGAGAALPQDTLIAAIDPAAMVFVGHRLDTGITVIFPKMGYAANPVMLVPPLFAVAGGNYTSNLRFIPLPDFGINWMIDKVSSFGMSVYALGGFGTMYRTTVNNGVFGGGVSISLLRQAVSSFTYARKISPSTSIGLSLLLAAQTFEADGASGLSIYSLDPGSMSNRGTDYSVGVGGRFGIFSMLTQWLNFAVSYQPVILMTKFTKYNGLFPNNGSFNIPANGLVGVAFKLWHGIKLAFDVQHIWYDSVPMYGHTDANLVNGMCLFADSSTCFGGVNGAGLGWQNQTAYKIGLQVPVTDKTTVRLGYNYSNSVLRPGVQFVTAILAAGAVIENVVTAGLTQKIGKDKELTAFVEYVPLQKMTGLNEFSGGAQRITVSATGWGGGLSFAWILD